MMEIPEKDDPAPAQKPGQKKIPKPVGGRSNPIFRRLSAHQQHVQHQDHLNHLNHMQQNVKK